MKPRADTTTKLVYEIQRHQNERKTESIERERKKREPHSNKESIVAVINIANKNSTAITALSKLKIEQQQTVKPNRNNENQVTNK